MSEEPTVRTVAAEHIGGEDALVELLEWGRDNLSADELSAYQADAKSGDRKRELAVVGNLQELRRLRERAARRGIENESAPPKPFSSKAELDAEVARLGGAAKAAKDPGFRRRRDVTPISKGHY